MVNAMNGTILLIAIICILALFVAIIRKRSPKSDKGFEEKQESATKGKAEYGSKKDDSLERIGYETEKQIAEIIKHELEEGIEGYVLQNLYIPKENGGTSEIDAVLICTKGLYVFESKNIAGYIFGDEKHREWTVTFFSGNKTTEKHKLYNPIWQNNTHIRHLKRYLNSSIPVNSVIVFSDRGELKNIPRRTESATIIQTRDLKEYLNAIRHSSPDLLTSDEVYDICLKLLQLTIVSEEKQQDHVLSIIEQQETPTICPWCGGRLIVRTAKRGDNAGKMFYGCSNYPKCRYTRNIE